MDKVLIKEEDLLVRLAAILAKEKSVNTEVFPHKNDSDDKTMNEYKKSPEKAPEEMKTSEYQPSRKSEEQIESDKKLSEETDKKKKNNKDGVNTSDWDKINDINELMLVTITVVA